MTWRGTWAEGSGHDSGDQLSFIETPRLRNHPQDMHISGHLVYWSYESLPNLGPNPEGSSTRSLLPPYIPLAQAGPSQERSIQVCPDVSILF